ncbi:hypothetical protein GCM10027294_31100 [Marinactinospora endophytica]
MQTLHPNGLSGSLSRTTVALSGAPSTHPAGFFSLPCRVKFEAVGPDVAGQAGGHLGDGIDGVEDAVDQVGGVVGERVIGAGALARAGPRSALLRTGRLLIQDAGART